jgi:hypothetical protein
MIWVISQITNKLYLKIPQRKGHEINQKPCLNQLIQYLTSFFTRAFLPDVNL